MFDRLDNYKKHMMKWFNLNKSVFLYVLLVTFIWGMVAHAYGFLHNNLSHDVLNAFIATPTEEIWKIELGRFFVPIYRFFRGAISLPWLIALLGLFWTALAIFFTSLLLDIKNKWIIALVAGIMTTNITYISQIATYLYEFDFNAFALFLSILTVYLWRNGRHWFIAVCATLSLLIVLCIYQAYLSISLTLIMWLVLNDLFKGFDYKNIFKKILSAFLIVLTSVFLYFLLGKIIYSITQIAPQSRVDIFSSKNIGSIITMFLSIIKPNINFIMTKLFHPAHTKVIKYISLMVAILSIIGLVITIYKKQITLNRIFLMLILVFLFPIGMNSVYFITKAGYVHDLMIYSLWFIYIFILIVPTYFEKTPIFLNKSTKSLSYFLIIVLLFQNIQLANTAYVKKELEANTTLSVMTRVVSDMEKIDGYSIGQSEIAFIGINKTSSRIAKFDNVSKITGLGDVSSISYYGVYDAYFKYVLNYPIDLCSGELQTNLKESEIVKAMPCFPNEGYIQWIDDVLVVKMSN